MLNPILAHVGHGHTDGNALVHYLIEPAHFPFAIAGLAMALAIYMLVVRRKTALQREET